MQLECQLYHGTDSFCVKSVEMVYMFSRSAQMARGVSKRGAAALNSVRVHIHEVVESKHHGFVYTQYQYHYLLFILVELRNSLSDI